MGNCAHLQIINSSEQEELPHSSSKKEISNAGEKEKSFCVVDVSDGIRDHCDEVDDNDKIILQSLTMMNFGCSF